MSKARLDRLCYMQKNRCHYCGTGMTRRDNSPTMATVDHIVPRISGGRNNRKNIVAACKWCNSSKGALDALQYLKLRDRPEARKWANLAAIERAKNVRL